MRYVEFQPSAPLAPLVHCYWIMEDADPRHAGVEESVSPDGCIEWILHYRAPFSSSPSEGIYAVQPRAVVAGQLTRSLHLRPGGEIGMLGVRFKPAGAARLVRMAVREWTDRVLPLADVLGQDAVELEARVLAARSDAQRVGLLDRFLHARLDHRDDRSEGIRRAVARIDEHHGQVSIDAMARCAGLGLRQFERRFIDAVGIGPKLFCRITRFRSLLHLLQVRPRSSWTARAVSCGYYDQSHLIRDFRTFTGRSPEDYLAANQPIEQCLIRADRS